MARKDPDHDPLSRDNVPGSLDHASGEVDEFEAALVRGGDGEEQVVSDEDLARQAEAAGGGGGGSRSGSVRPVCPHVRGPAGRRVGRCPH